MRWVGIKKTKYKRFKKKASRLRRRRLWGFCNYTRVVEVTVTRGRHARVPTTRATARDVKENDDERDARSEVHYPDGALY